MVTSEGDMSDALDAVDSNGTSKKARLTKYFSNMLEAHSKYT